MTGATHILTLGEDFPSMYGLSTSDLHWAMKSLCSASVPWEVQLEKDRWIPTPANSCHLGLCIEQKFQKVCAALKSPGLPDVYQPAAFGG